MWRCQVALILMLATPALAADQVTHRFLVMGDSFTTTAGSDRIFGPYYGPIFSGYTFGDVNVGISATTTCEFVDPTFDGLAEDDLTAILDAAVADGPYFASVVQWSSNDNSAYGQDARGAARFDHCYRLIIDALDPVVSYIFINSAAIGVLELYDDVIRQIILDYPKVYLGSEIYDEPDWADFIADPTGGFESPADNHPNAAGSEFWTDQLDVAIGTVIRTNAGDYRRARR